LFLGTTSDINITKIEKFNPVVMQKDQWSNAHLENQQL
jgi:hypothetical protein